MTSIGGIVMSKSISLGESIWTQDKIKLTFDESKTKDSKVSAKLLPNDTIDIKLPPKLSAINKETDFTNYCKLAYSRINTTNEVIIYYDKPEGSITPRSEGDTCFLKVQSIEDFGGSTLKVIENESCLLYTSDAADE